MIPGDSRFRFDRLFHDMTKSIKCTMHFKEGNIKEYGCLTFIKNVMMDKVTLS